MFSSFNMLLLASALAQSPGGLQMPKLDLSSLGSGGLLDGLSLSDATPTSSAVVYAVSGGPALRWPGQELASFQVSVGDRLEVVLRQDDLIRVRRGTDFGWVSPSAVSDTPPEE